MVHRVVLLAVFLFITMRLALGPMHVGVPEVGGI